MESRQLARAARRQLLPGVEGIYLYITPAGEPFNFGHSASQQVVAAHTEASSTERQAKQREQREVSLWWRWRLAASSGQPAAPTAPSRIPLQTPYL